MARKVEQEPIPNASLSPTDDRLWRLDSKPQKIYVAAPLPNKVLARKFANELIFAGFGVTSRWLDRDFSRRKTLDWSASVAIDEEMGAIDVEDVLMADTLVILANEPSSSGGYHVELGIFLGARKTNIIVVGERSNVFYWTEHVRFTHGVEGLVEWLKSPDHGRASEEPARDLCLCRCVNCMAKQHTKTECRCPHPPELPHVFDKFKYNCRSKDESTTSPGGDLLKRYMEPAVAAIGKKIEDELLSLCRGFIDCEEIRPGTDAFACSMRANWLEAERQIKYLKDKYEIRLNEDRNKTLPNYDKFVDDFWFIGDADLQMPEPAYLGLCLAGEAGEVAEKLKKAYRDHGGKVDPDAMVKELGDVLYYLVRYAHVLGSDLEGVARKNVEKLQDRAARNALRGEGDHR